MLDLNPAIRDTLVSRALSALQSLPPSSLIAPVAGTALLLSSEREAMALLARLLLQAQSQLAHRSEPGAANIESRTTLLQVLTEALAQALNNDRSIVLLTRASQQLQQQLTLIAADLAERWQLPVPPDPVAAWYLPPSAQLQRRRRRGTARQAQREPRAQTRDSEPQESVPDGDREASAALTLSEWLAQVAYPDEYGPDRGPRAHVPGGLLNQRI